MAIVTILEGVIQILPPLALNAGGSTAWPDITGKPTEFPPEPHTHAIASVIGLQAALDAKAALAHLHTISDVTGLQTALDVLAASIAGAGGAAHPDWGTKFRVVAGVIEKAAGATTWSLLAPNTQHSSFNVSGISFNTGAYIDILFSGLSVKNVLLSMANFHKDGDGRYFASARGLLTSIQIYVRASMPIFQCFITYNGSTWSLSLTDGNGASILSQSAQDITIDHPNDYCIGAEIITSTGNIAAYKGSTGYSYIQSRIALASAPTTGTRVYLQRRRRDERTIVNPNNIGNAPISPTEKSNIWFFGIVELN